MLTFDFLDTFARALLSLTLPALFLLTVINGAVFVFAERRSTLHFTLFAWVTLAIARNILANMVGGDTPPGLSGVASGMLAATLALVVAVSWFAIYRRTDQAVPRLAAVAEAVKATGLEAAATWLQVNTIALRLPAAAQPVLADLRTHLRAVIELKLRPDHPAHAAILKLLDSELRDLLVRYQRVEIARRLVPGGGSLGDKELLLGLQPVLQAMVAQRRSLADAAVNDLKVQQIFLETKHSDSPLS